ncbi:MAG TPA: deoxyribodipyrimidine photo-lyase [Puia sp.]|uniref:cryptochrome/photolyase family protein n=1 Tax=Puia sp. TaxID=2045100 RepID=UPI002C1B3D2D|nr:deoxyribodipyrimidine photo-lyase [Puia sp.]HVU94856.1 deoxyribodipyrimidine photo-lyase [Puia sp.]
MRKRVNICWFRRDLRLRDNAALYYALREGHPVVALFIFDRTILDKLRDKADRRVEFIFHAVMEMYDGLAAMGSPMEVLYGEPMEVFGRLMRKYEIMGIFANGDYEPDAIARDSAIEAIAKEAGVRFSLYKDQVMFEKTEIVKDDGHAYSVFTPYCKRWRSMLSDFYLKSYPTASYFSNFLQDELIAPPTLEELGFKKTNSEFPPINRSRDMFRQYGDKRDYPAVGGTSRLGVHLRFGTISIRELARYVMEISDKFLNELIWREFYQMILWNFPEVGQGRAFKKEYENIVWRNNEEEFDRWCKGQTGYPIVDAGMRELNETGYMHNRVRMITASFLTKHLLIDWRWGEAYFAGKLLDFDLASNNGGWQWAAGCGCDAAPYFRIFNPYLQTKKFDPQLDYVREWVPEWADLDYPAPMVDHEWARKRCLEAYSGALRVLRQNG